MDGLDGSDPGREQGVGPLYGWQTLPIPQCGYPRAQLQEVDGPDRSGPARRRSVHGRVAAVSRISVASGLALDLPETCRPAKGSSGAWGRGRGWRGDSHQGHDGHHGDRLRPCHGDSGSEGEGLRAGRLCMNISRLGCRGRPAPRPPAAILAVEVNFDMSVHESGRDEAAPGVRPGPGRRELDHHLAQGPRRRRPPSTRCSLARAAAPPPPRDRPRRRPAARRERHDAVPRAPGSRRGLQLVRNRRHRHPTPSRTNSCAGLGGADGASATARRRRPRRVYGGGSPVASGQVPGSTRGRQRGPQDRDVCVVGGHDQDASLRPRLRGPPWVVGLTGGSVVDAGGESGND